MGKTPPPLPSPPGPEGAGQIVIYRDGATRLQVRIDGRTVWLSQRLIAELFQVSVPTVNEHLTSIYADGEIDPGATIRSFRIVQREGRREVSRSVEHYSLDAILAVGYRVRSHRGTAFRQWATARLAELLVKGFTLDDERLKAGRTLQRINTPRGTLVISTPEATALDLVGYPHRAGGLNQVATVLAELADVAQDMDAGTRAETRRAQSAPCERRSLGSGPETLVSQRLVALLPGAPRKGEAR